MLIIAGLGNPGPKYENNRHNVGFMAADAIHRRHSFSPWSKKVLRPRRRRPDRRRKDSPDQAADLHGTCRARPWGEAMRFHKLSPQDIVVLYDELDLAPGKVRVKTGGGTGGHNGIKVARRPLRQGLPQGAHRHRPSRRQAPGHQPRARRFREGRRRVARPFARNHSDEIDLLVQSDDAGFMSKVAQATKGKPTPAAAPRTILSPSRRARATSPGTPKARPVKQPESGHLPQMLKKLFNRGLRSVLSPSDEVVVLPFRRICRMGSPSET